MTFVVLVALHLGIGTALVVAFFAFEDFKYWSPLTPIAIAFLWPILFTLGTIAAGLDYLMAKRK